MAPMESVHSVRPTSATSANLSQHVPPLSSARPTSAPVHRVSIVPYRPRPSVIEEQKESRDLALEAKDLRSTERERAELRLLVENDDRFGYAMDCAKRTLEKSAGCPLMLGPLAELVWRVLCILWDVEASRFVPKARLKTIIERLREELKAERQALEDSRRSYLKELVGLRERCRNLDPKVEALVDEHVYEDEPVYYYEPLQYLDEKTREHVAEIVEEKLKLILMKLTAGRGGGSSATSEEDPIAMLREKLRCSEQEVEDLGRQLKQLRAEHAEMQNTLMTVVQKAQEQKQKVDEEKNAEKKRAEEERAALVQRMEDDKKLAERQQQEALEMRRKTETLEKEMADLQASAEANAANSMELRRRVTEIESQKSEQEARAAALEKESAEAAKDAAIAEKSLSKRKQRWSNLRTHAFKIAKGETGWKSLMSIITTVSDHTKDIKIKVAEKDHEIGVLHREITFLISELTAMMDLDDTEERNLKRVSNRRIMAWMAGEELSTDDAHPEGWSKIRQLMRKLASKVRRTGVLPGDEDQKETNPHDHPSNHKACNEEIARLKAEIEQLKATIDRLMVELAAATGSANMEALRAKLGDGLNWVFGRPSGNVFQRLYDDAAARERRNTLLRERFAEMQQERIMEDTLGKHRIPESLKDLFDGTSTVDPHQASENISVFGFTTTLESSGHGVTRHLMASPQATLRPDQIKTSPQGRAIDKYLSNEPTQPSGPSAGSRSLPRPTSAMPSKPPPLVTQDIRPDGVRPVDLYRLASHDPRSAAGPPPPRRPASAVARRLQAEREDEQRRRRPASAAGKSVGGRVLNTLPAALSGSRSLPGLHL